MRRWETSTDGASFLLKLFLAGAGTACFLAAANAQSPPPQSGGPIIQGSPDVSVGGSSAARQGDTTKNGGPVVQGSPDVFINGKPATTSGDSTACGGAVVGGSSNVFVNGKPLARTGDNTGGLRATVARLGGPRVLQDHRGAFFADHD
jgi:uncharacterized Zn-binding protein involved in type VI secretion